MNNENMKTILHPIPPRDPVSGGELYISELSNDESGITIRGKFEISRFAKLDAEHVQFLEAFLKCRGMLSHVEKELGISYPTVRGRLDALLVALDLHPPQQENRREAIVDEKRRIIEQLENGELSAQEAKRRLQELR